MRTISIQCPECGFRRLIDTSGHALSETYAISKHPVNWIPDYIQKCHKCGKQIGIKKVG